MTQPAYKIIWVDSDSNETIGQGTELNCTFHTVCDRKFLIVKAIALNNEAEKLNISLSVPENGYLNVDCGSEITLTVQVQTGEKNLLSPEDLYRMIEGKKPWQSLKMPMLRQALPGYHFSKTSVKFLPIKKSWRIF
jgi:hypothetical protein